MRSDYSIATHGSHEGKTVVYIIDEDRGGMSVTNDAERVVMELRRVYPFSRIVYRDSMGNWDELVTRGSVFTGFARWTGWTPMVER